MPAWNMKTQDMKDIVKDAYEHLKSTPSTSETEGLRQSLRGLIFVVSELVSREDERVRKGM